MRTTYHYRSFFWPALLVLVGVVALLVNVGAIPVDRLYLLVDLWPVILIVIGLELVIRHSFHGVVGDVAAALVVLLAIAGALGYVAAAPNPNSTHTMDASAPVGNLEQAAVEVDVGAAIIDVAGSNDLGSDLYRVHIEYSGPAPEVDFDDSAGKVTISQPSRNGFFLGARKFNLTLQINTGIPWTVSENSGAATDTIDLTKVHVTSMTLNTGASREDITLGPPSGTVPVVVNGGALTVHVHRPSGVPVSIQVSGGAVTLTADGHSYHAIGSAGYDSNDFEGATDRYRIAVNGGACTVTLDANAPSG